LMLHLWYLNNFLGIDYNIYNNTKSINIRN